MKRGSTLLKELLMITQCCQCKRYRIEDRWVTRNGNFPDRGQISHSYCPQCAKQLNVEIMNYHLNPNLVINSRSKNGSTA